MKMHLKNCEIKILTLLHTKAKKDCTERSSLGVPQRWASEKCGQEMEGREALKIFVF